MPSLPEVDTLFSETTLCILRFVVGIVLGLLTVYRREMSCNRVYHPEDVVDEQQRQEQRRGDSSLHGARKDEDNNSNAVGADEQQSSLIRRRNSSSDLATMFQSNDDHNQHHNNTSNNKHRQHTNDDPTEELLESAGFFFSGGPFLAIALAVFDHMILTVFLTSVASVSSLLLSFKPLGRNDSSGGGGGKVVSRGDVSPQRELPTKEEEELTKLKNERVHHVAWNAATEYFTSISSKLDEAPLPPSKSSNSYNYKVKRPLRSKSTGNIAQLSTEQYNEIMALARGNFDISLLPSDAEILIFSFLHPKDVLNFTCTNRAGRRMLDDGLAIANEKTESQHDKAGDSALLIWKALFQRDFAWVLSDWKIGKEAFARSMIQYKLRGWQEEFSSSDEESHGGRVMQHLLSSVGESNSDDAMTAFLPPTHGSTQTSMKELYFTFAETWLNYTIAGCNSTEKCLIGLHNHVFDISNFVDSHPGSTETLLLQAGKDATVFFESMGHSMGARKLALSMCVVVNGQCVDWDGIEGGTLSFSNCKNNTRGSDFACGLSKPSSKSLIAKKSTPGFLIPRKRSKPRTYGGLHRIRHRIKYEEEVELVKAARWGTPGVGIGGPRGMFGGVNVYYDPICSCWRWWYLDLEFNAVFVDSVN